MKDRILTEPAFGLGFIVWVVAGTLFPFHLGTSGASILAFAAYLAIAGLLLAVADALFNTASYHSIGDVVFQGVFWLIGLSIPALASFLVGMWAAPMTVAFEDDLCRMAGLSHLEVGPESALEEVLEPTEECEAGS